MSISPVMSVSIQSESDVANVRNVVRLSMQLLNFPLAHQARVGWAVTNLAHLMMTLGYKDTMVIEHVLEDTRKGIRIQCKGRWLQLVRSAWIERLTMADSSQWMEEVLDCEDATPCLKLTAWSPSDGG